MKTLKMIIKYCTINWMRKLILQKFWNKAETLLIAVRAESIKTETLLSGYQTNQNLFWLVWLSVSRPDRERANFCCVENIYDLNLGERIEKLILCSTSGRNCLCIIYLKQKYLFSHIVSIILCYKQGSEYGVKSLANQD